MAPKSSFAPVLSALYVWGYNKSGQIAALNVRRSLRVPKRVAPSSFEDAGNLCILEVACSLQHTAAVASDGSLYTWGSNEFGQLGDGSEDNHSEPKQVEALQNELVKSVACCANCTAAISQPRNFTTANVCAATMLWVWGQNQESNYPQRFCGAFSPTLKKIIAALPDDEPLAKQSIQVSTALLSRELTRKRENRLILIDGKAVVYRAYYKLMAKLQHGLLNDTSGEGDWVLTVFTALSTVLKVFELTPSHIAVIFDHEGLTFRHTLFSNYKVNRSPTPDTVVQSLRYIKPALTAMGIKTVEVPGVEADDVIGTLAVTAIKAETKVRVLSPDKDFFQLISPSLRLLRFVPRGSGIVSFGLEEFQARYGDLEPAQFVDILALMGDRIDNIPGVPGIGEKTAVKLIKLYGSLEKLVKERDSVKGKRALSGLLADKGEVFLGKRLVTLRTDLPHYIVPFSLGDFLYKKPQDEGDRFFNLLKAMGSFVDGPFVADLEKRIQKLWLKYN